MKLPFNKHYSEDAPGKMSIPGFRPGKAPRKIIEGHYGADVFMKKQLNIVLPRGL